MNLIYCDEENLIMEGDHVYYNYNFGFGCYSTVGIIDHFTRSSIIVIGPFGETRVLDKGAYRPYNQRPDQLNRLEDWVDENKREVYCVIFDVSGKILAGGKYKMSDNEWDVSSALSFARQEAWNRLEKRFGRKKGI